MRFIEAKSTANNFARYVRNFQENSSFLQSTVYTMPIVHCYSLHFKVSTQNCPLPDQKHIDGFSLPFGKRLSKNIFCKVICRGRSFSQHNNIRACIFPDFYISRETGISKIPNFLGNPWIRRPSCPGKRKNDKNS